VSWVVLVAVGFLVVLVVGTGLVALVVLLIVRSGARSRSESGRMASGGAQEIARTPGPAGSHQGVGCVGPAAAIAGLMLPILLAMLFRLLAERNLIPDAGPYYGLCLLLFGACEVAALVCGAVSWRSGAGKAGLAIGVVSVVVGALVLGFVTVTTQADQPRDIVVPDEPVPMP
jgi:cytochrome c biogenesis factor